MRWQVEKLISLIENQLYCVTGLDSSDNEALKEPHRKAYLQDLLSELEIAQRGIHRLETRVNGLYDSYQAMGSSRVEKRLRILTIISAITLPFSLIAGLLGMNVGGLPATQDPQGFIIVIILMIVIGAVEVVVFQKERLAGIVSRAPKQQTAGKQPSEHTATRARNKNSPQTQKTTESPKQQQKTQTTTKSNKQQQLTILATKPTKHRNQKPAPELTAGKAKTRLNHVINGPVAPGRTPRLRYTQLTRQRVEGSSHSSILSCRSTFFLL